MQSVCNKSSWIKGIDGERNRERMNERERVLKEELIPTYGPNCDESNNNMGASRSNNNYFLNIIVQSWYTRISDLSDVY